MKLLLALSLLFPCFSQAVEFDASIGAARFSDRGNMFWYQEGLPHQLQLSTLAVDAGFTGDIWRSGRYGVAWHANYAFLGPVKSNAVATPDDANYNRYTKSCEGECIAHSNFTGRGKAHGLRLTVEPYFYVDGWRIGVDAGVFFARNIWKMTVYDWVPERGAEPRTIRVDDSAGFRFYPTFALSIGRGNADVVLRYYRNQSRTDPTTGSPAIWSHTTTLTLRYRF